MGFPDRPHDAQPSAEPHDSGYEQQGYTQEPGYSQTPGFPGYQQTPGYQSGYQGPPARSNGMAITSLVCGVAQFLLWFFILIPGFIAAVAALIFGVVGLGQIRQRGEGGRGLAIAGIVLGILGVLGGVAWAILFAVGTTHFHYHGY
jgi:hypothetical protein